MTSKEACEILNQELKEKEIGSTSISYVCENKWDRERVISLVVTDESIIKRAVGGWHFQVPCLDYDDPEDDSGCYLLSFYGEEFGLKRNEDATPEIIKKWCATLFE